MNRFFTLIVAGILFITFSSFLKFFRNDVTISVDMPDVIEAGTEITVTVTINKGKLSYFARYQQELPYGFTAMAVNSANANFSFQDQKVQLVWLRVPDEDEIVFSYKIISNERLTGKIDLGGRFTYIDNNERKSVDQQPRLLAIKPSPNMNPAMQIDVLEYAKVSSIEAVATRGGQTAALRQRPVWMAEDKVFLVTLLINKDAVQKFAKIEETVPQGYTAASIDSKGGIFSYANQVAKFIWMDLPVEPYFTVSYKLIPNDGVTPNPASIGLSGVFSYMINERTFSSDIIERQETLASLSNAQVNDLLRGITVKTIEQQPLLVAETSTPKSSSTPQTQTSSQTPSTPSQSTPQTSSTPQVSSTSNPVPTTTTTTSTPSSVATTPPARVVTTTNDASDLLKPESGVYYRVQIAAGHKPVNTQRYFRSYRLEYSVAKETHEGWFKYTVGSFGEYKDARDYRVHLSNTTKLNDAFIAAYNNGKRITVQDALMALNQKWIR